MKVFQTKFVNDKLYNRNGQEVKIIEECHNGNIVVEFPDGTRATVYETEVIDKRK